MSQFSVDSMGWVTKTPVLVASLHRAQAYATQQQHRQLTLDHLLLALTEDTNALVVLHASKIDVEKLRSAISDIVGRNEDRMSVPDLGGPAASSELVTIFEYASAAADQSGRGMIDGAIVLAALIGEGNSPAARLLETHGLTFEHAIASLQNMTATQPSEPLTEAQVDHEAAMQAEKIIKSELAVPPRQPVKDSSVLVSPSVAPIPQPRPTSDSARLASSNPGIIPPIAPEMRPPPVAAAPVQQPSSDIPPSFSGDGSTQLQPAPPLQSRPEINGAPQPVPGVPIARAPAPQAPPQQAPRPNQSTGRAQAPAPGTNGAQYTQAPHPSPPQGGLRGPQAAQPNTAQPAQFNDDMIAPWPDPETASAPPPPAPPRPMPSSAPPQGQRPPQAPKRKTAMPAPAQAQGQFNGTPVPNAVIEEGQLIENIPRKMRVGIAEQIEVRIARNSVNVPVDNMRGSGTPQSHNLYVTKAMTVRLRAPEGGIRIETSSPETQWIDNALGLIQDDFASWRWTVTPDMRGAKKLQLVVSARSVGSDGVAAETALPDQVFDVMVRMNYARTAARLGGWAAAAAAGGAFATFGEDAYKKILELANLL